MDFGQDACIATKYAHEHNIAESVIADVSTTSLSSILKTRRDQRDLLKHDLSYLSDHGYTPSIIAAMGIKWGVLQRHYGATALLEFGFNWEQMRSMGISASEACSIGMDKLGISANELMELLPTIADIASLRLPISSLKNSGFSMERLITIGLDVKTMKQFQVDLNSWSSTYSITNEEWQKLGFTDTNNAQQQGWSSTELHAVGMFSTNSSSVRTAACASGGIQF